MWFTETPWPPILAAGIIAAVLIVLWSSTSRGAYLVAAAALVPVCVGLYFLERAVVTEAERVEAAVHGIAAAFQQRDLERTLGYISPQAEDMRQQAAAALNMVVVQSLRITDVEVETRADDTLAVSRFRANGTTTQYGSFATYWQVTWQRQADQWQATGYQRLNPVTGEPMGLLSGQ